MASATNSRSARYRANYMRLCARVKALRQAYGAKGLSQQQVATILGITQPSYSALESGRNRFTAAQIKALARALKADVSELMALLPPPQPRADHIQFSIRRNALAVRIAHARKEGWTFAEIGARHGISRQRAAVIAKSVQGAA